jgi:uncharacterized membrane protein
VGKYDPLQDFLASQPADQRELTMSFTDIENLVGRLPPYARSRPAWWANSGVSDAGQAWRQAGWQVESTDQRAELVVFARAGNAPAAPVPVAAAATVGIPVHQHTDVDERRKHALERIAFFSDAVFAISITILGLDLTLPDHTTASNLPRELASLWPKYGAFAFTFTLIGLRWLTHHLQFRDILDYDYTLLGLNLALLLVVAFLPFPSRVLAEYPDSRAACALYVGSMAAAGLLSTALWIHACWLGGLVDKRLPPGTQRNLLLRWITLPVLFGISLILLYAVPGNFWPARAVALATPLVQILIAALTPKAAYEAGTAGTAASEQGAFSLPASG